MTQKNNSRLVAAEIVHQWLEDQSFPDRQLAGVQQDHAFILELVNGIVRQWSILQWLERRWLKRPPGLFYRAVLYVGLYQLLFMKVEEYAAIHETVEAAKVHGGGRGPFKMINAVLRRAQREREQVFAALEKKPAALRLSHPQFLMGRWSQQYGREASLALAEWNNQPPETMLRVERTKMDVAEFRKKLEEAGIDVLPHPFVCDESFFVLPRGVSVKDVPGYVEGWFTVQDPATSVSVDLLDPKPGESVLDACAAPGGKTAMLAGRMRGEGELVAMDLHEDRLATLAENRERLGLDWIEVVQGDARWPGKALGERRFDAILLDVPCLNTGVFRRRADARWRIEPERIETITRLQSRILSASAELLKPGGRMVYSTCSLEREENELLVEGWLAEHSDFELVTSKSCFPPESGTDGAFAAVLRRR